MRIALCVPKIPFVKSISEKFFSTFYRELGKRNHKVELNWDSIIKKVIK